MPHEQGNFTSLGVVVTSKGRAEALSQTLPKLIQIPAATIVLVDYDCPSHSYRVGEKYGCVVVRVENAPYFHPARARNIGAEEAIKRGCDFLCFVDADTLVSEDFGRTVHSLSRPSRFLCFPKQPRPSRLARILGRSKTGAFDGLGGCLIVPTEAFLTAKGYDEWYQGYGRETADMRLNLYYQGFEYAYLPKGLARHIAHGDRTRYYQIKDKRESRRLNGEYLLSKVRNWHAETGRPLPVDLWPFLARVNWGQP